MLIVVGSFISTEKEFTWGKLNHVKLGEEGRGRKEVLLPIPVEIGTLTTGVYPDLSVGQTKSGRPRIIKGDSGVYVLASTRGGYTRRGDGVVHVPKGFEGVTVLEKAWGADGIAGRIGTWDDVLIKVETDEPVILRVKMAGINPSVIAVIYNKTAHFASSSEIEPMFEALELEMPFSLDETQSFSREDWTML